MSLLFQSTPATLGKVFAPGEVIIQQGDPSENLFVVLEGRLEVLIELPEEHPPVQVAILEKDDIFGELSVLDEAPRCATVRALEESRVLTVDRKGFMQRIQEDPSLAWRIMAKQSRRIHTLNHELVAYRLKEASPT